MQRAEQQIHRAVVAHLRQRGMPGVVFFHVPNGAFFGARRAIQGAIMKRLGMRAGVADLIILHGGRGYALELKAQGGRATEAQMEFMDDWRRAGGFGVIAEGLDRALQCLETWGILRGNAA